MTIIKHLILAMIVAAIITVIIAVVSGFLGKTFDSTAVMFLIGFTAALSVSQPTKEGR